jgi:glycosyltransferase involved in cell wall biosynthesis
VLGYLGIIADQDGVDHLIRMMAHIVHDGGRRDVRAVIVGDGPALASVKALARSLGVAEQVTFTGYLRGQQMLAAISTFDIGIIPDPVNEYNDKISMNKVFEYSTLGIPSVSYDLSETRRLLGEVGTFAKDATPHGLAEAALSLIDDEARRRDAGARAGKLADEKFNWDGESRKYVEVYETLVKIRAYA